MIPALNEAATIGLVTEEAKRVAKMVIVVNDGSTDATASLAKKAGALVINHGTLRGYDAALAAGLNEAFRLGAKAAVTCDADHQHRIVDLIRVAEPVCAGKLDFCGGFRLRYNRRIEAALGLPARVFFGTRDPFCGLKCYGRLLFNRFGPFPAELNVGTLPLLWLRQEGVRSEFLEIQTEARVDEPRFGGSLRASVKLTIAFLKTLRQLSSIKR